ncbi:MAG: type II CAAX prenyl endopeptidase Rce1 family protein, partial [Caldilineaceae bacterium]
MYKAHTPSPYRSMADNERNAARHRSPLAYVVLTLTLSLPFWLLGAVSRFQLLPSIPVSALMIVAPVTAALIFVYRENKAASVMALLKRSFDYKRVSAQIWYLPTLLLMPGIMVIAYVVLRLAGVALPNPYFSLITTLVLFALFFVAALCEELGWAGYVTDPLQARFGALGGSLLLGVVWAVWHFIPLWEAQRSLDWIAWWSL